MHIFVNLFLMMTISCVWAVVPGTYSWDEPTAKIAGREIFQSASNNGPCRSDQFYCGTGSIKKCIAKSLQCNGDWDCTNGRDERKCSDVREETGTRNINVIFGSHPLTTSNSHFGEDNTSSSGYWYRPRRQHRRRHRHHSQHWYPQHQYSHSQRQYPENNYQQYWYPWHQ